VRGLALAKYGAAGLAGWAVASQIALQSHLLNAISRCAVGVSIYVGALFLMDSRVRALPAYLLRSRRTRSVDFAIGEDPVLSEIAAEEEEVCK
jgi:hypothetical protein